MSKHEYEVNRKRVSEIFGLNPDEVSCHHICFRSDAKNKKSPLYKMDVDELSNLYPFPVDGPGHYSSEHIRTHELIERNEPQANTKKGKRKSVVLYKAKKKRR